VGELLDEQNAQLGLRLLAGRAGLDREIDKPRVQRPGLALTGYTDYIRYGRLQILGGSELGYLRTLKPAQRRSILRRLCECRISCLVITKGQAPPGELAAAAEAAGVPLLVSELGSTPFIEQVSALLEARLAPRASLHSVLMDIFGLGVLIVGESGVGKSECALDLIERGHRLVADDLTEVRRVGDELTGSSCGLGRDHMEIRGVGLINIKDLYGVSSLRREKRVELVVTLERWRRGRTYERLGLERESFELLGISLPMLRLPVAPGRNLAIIVEVAARSHLLKERGYDAAAELTARVDAVASGASLPRRGRKRGR
jgi:HPr kinase/phosphorylase